MESLCMNFFSHCIKLFNICKKKRQLLSENCKACYMKCLSSVNHNNKRQALLVSFNQKQ